MTEEKKTDEQDRWILECPATQRSLVRDEFEVLRHGRDLILSYKVGGGGLVLTPDVARFLLDVLPDALGVESKRSANQPPVETKAQRCHEWVSFMVERPTPPWDFKCEVCGKEHRGPLLAQYAQEPCPGEPKPVETKACPECAGTGDAIYEGPSSGATLTVNRGCPECKGTGRIPTAGETGGEA